MALNFSYLKSSSELDNDELKILYKLLDLDFLKDPANKYLLSGSLVTLTNLLYKHHKISPILLIDEYDVPVAKGTGIIKSVLYCSSMNMMFLLPKPHISVTTVK